jgi:Protein of unknown function (DUF5131)
MVADGSSIEWTQATWNPTTGCDQVSAGCDNCLAPDTPVLMADMSWRPIGKIAPGGEIVGFTDIPGLGQNRLYERATVEHAWTTTAEAVEITVGDLGMPIWLPDTDSEPYLAGYLAGAISGDGTFRIAGSGKNGTKQSYLRLAVLERPVDP